MTVTIERDRAHRPILDLDVEKVVRRPMADLVMLAATFGGQEIFGRGLLEILLPGKFVRALAAEKDVRRPFHDGPRKADGVSGRGHAGDGAGVALASIHDGGVRLYGPLIGEDRSPT